LNELFEERWARKERECGFEGLATEMVACGPDVLPTDAAPDVNFDRAARPVPIWEVFGPRADWPPADRERLDPYRMIGSDGCGNPICLVQATGSVVLLDHEDRFRTVRFVNSSIRQLGECLLAYMGEEDPDRFRLAIADIDPAALAEGAFWWYEATCLEG
jgi:hypothetical protein